MSPISNQFGRVDESNNVFVFEPGGERKVGQYPGVTEQEALSYFERKFAELEANVRILEQRVKSNADPSSIATAASKLRNELVEPAAVGNLSDLRFRIDAVAPNIERMRQEKQDAIKKALEETRQLRQELVSKATELANKDPKKIQWKRASEEMAGLFEKWQASQKSGPKLPRKEADAIWKQFSQARNKFEANKRAFFAELTAETKAMKQKKAELVSKAEALVAKGSAGLKAYRDLLEQWKKTGRSNGKTDEALWERFKSAGDSIYELRKVELEKEKVEFEANLKAKLEILVEAEAIDPAKDLAQAKKQLLTLSQKYEKIGKVPRDKMKSIEDRMKAVERKVRNAEQEVWRKTDPATIERTNGVLSQLEDSIEKLEEQLRLATSKNDPRLIADAQSALDARKSWLEVVKQSAN